jgi:membrane protein required for colicin V production
MHLFDLLLLILLGLGFLWGLRKGLIQTMASLLALILGIYVALRYNGALAQLMTQWFDWSKKNADWVSFIVLFILTVTAIVILGKWVTKLAGLVALGWINRLLGALLYTAQTALILSYVLWFFAQVKLDDYLLPENTKTESRSYGLIAGFAPTVTPMIQDFWNSHWGSNQENPQNQE